MPRKIVDERGPTRLLVMDFTTEEMELLVASLLELLTIKAPRMRHEIRMNRLIFDEDLVEEYGEIKRLYQRISDEYSRAKKG